MEAMWPEGQAEEPEGWGLIAVEYLGLGRRWTVKSPMKFYPRGPSC